MKSFDTWNTKKKSLDQHEFKPPLVKTGDLWWASIGENIGSEIDGKSDLFSRPVIIFKKLSHNFYFVIPTTTKIKTGSWYTKYTFSNKEVCACLHQARAIDYRRLSTKLGQLDERDLDKVKNAFQRLYL